MNQPQEKPPEFDTYANDYAALIHDPIRDKFAAGSQFFFKRKLEVICDFFEHAGMQTGKLDWLDVGCGQGDLLRLGRDSFKSIAGCDPSEGMLKSCEGLDVRHQTEMEKLPFSDGAFDFITVVCVYHHVSPERRSLLTAEAVRVLRPGGMLCVIEHNPWNPVTKLIVSRTPVDADAQLLTAVETGRFLSAAGCDSVETRYFLLFPERLHRFTRSLEDTFRALPFGGQYAVFGRKLGS